MGLLCNQLGTIYLLWRKEGSMAKSKRVSGKTHTKQQLDDYANQNNPNNKAYKARVANQKKTKKEYIDSVADLEWFCYGNPFDFD